jgi:hypothetical protein
LLIPDGKAGRLFVGLLIKLNVHEMMPADARYVKGEGTSEADKSLSSLLRGYRRLRVSLWVCPRPEPGVFRITPVSGKCLVPLPAAKTIAFTKLPASLSRRSLQVIGIGLGRTIQPCHRKPLLSGYPYSPSSAPHRRHRRQRYLLSGSAVASHVASTAVGEPPPAQALCAYPQEPLHVL